LHAYRIQAIVPIASADERQAARAVELDARNLALLSLVDIATFFAVLLVGFAYVWRRGDLDWVRAVSKERSAQPGIVVEEEPLAA
jgi:NADH-quinone oxidoreductase subunit A